MAASKRSESPDSETGMCGLQLNVDVMGKDVSLDVPEDCRTVAQLCLAVAEAGSLKPGGFELLLADGTAVDDDDVVGLEAGTCLKAVPCEEDMKLVNLVLAIQAAAEMLDRGDEIRLNERTEDPCVSGWLPECVENVFRHWDSVSFNWSLADFPSAYQRGYMDTYYPA